MGNRRWRGEELVTRRAAIVKVTALIGAAALLLSSACAEGTMKMNTLQAARLLEDIIARLSAPGASVASLSQLLGPVREKYTGSGYDLAPADPRLAKAWIGIREDAGMSEVLTDVELDLAPSSPLPLAELDQALGPRRDLPPAPNGPLYRVVYDRERGSSTHKATVIATLSGPGNQPKVEVQRLLIRSDAR